MLVRAHKPAFKNKPHASIAFFSNNPMEASTSSETYPMEGVEKAVGGATNGVDHVRHMLHAKKWLICKDNLVKMAHSKWNFPNDFGKKGIDLRYGRRRVRWLV